MNFALVSYDLNRFACDSGYNPVSFCFVASAVYRRFVAVRGAAYADLQITEVLSDNTRDTLDGRLVGADKRGQCLHRSD